MELERVLTKLKFDDTVSGYALLTNDGHPFLSFSLPDEVLPQIQGALRIHAASLKLMNVLTGEGTVILARADINWVLAVLFLPDQQLGVVLQKTKDVVNLLQQVDLPPPPTPVHIPEPPVAEVPRETTPVVTPVPEPEPVPIVPTPAEEEPPAIVEVKHGCVVFRGVRYSEAMSLETELNKKLKQQFSNAGVDVLLMIDEKRTVYKIGESLAKSSDQVISIINWCLTENIVSVECPETQEAGAVEIIELPLFEGDIKKAKKEHRAILEMCNGRRTLQDIAADLNIPYFNALQSIIPYRGKTLKFIRKDRRVDV
ncbi:MAG: hypothetical protein ACFE7R_05650 [Candidatus Hodarchaeota archaeon]